MSSFVRGIEVLVFLETEPSVIDYHCVKLNFLKTSKIHNLSFECPF